MPDLDKNYLAGLYLDEITLDVMPQEYIDAALEVKLRYDACAPRAGYVCVQDRRVRGGFYYRKAPQGQGVNALPPSKLERALARSQEPPKSETGFLSKAAIGAGLAVGGLALTGAVVNAGRSSEPYQEPVRQRPTLPPSNTSRNIAVGVGAAATVGLGVGTAIANKSTPPANTDIKEVEPNVVVNPKTSASTEVQKTQAPEEVASTEREQGRKEQEARNEAIKQTVEVAIPRTISAYENTLAVKYSRQGGLKEGKEKAAQYKPEGDENFVRLSSLQYSIEKREPTKASIAKTSEDLQKMYDKLKEYGLEDSIEFRKARSQARGKEGQELTSTSSNPYTVKINGVSENVGEVRFTRSQKDIQDAIAEKIKNPQAQSNPPEKSAKPTTEKTPSSVENIPAVVEQPKALKEQAQGALANAIRRGAPSTDGYVNQSSLLNDKVLKSRLAGNDPAALIAEGIDNGRIQTKKVGKNTYVRDIEAIPLKDFVAEAKGLSDVKDLNGDRRVKDLREALDYRKARIRNEDDRAGVDELEAAIAGIQVIRPEPRQPSIGSDTQQKKGRRSETNKDKPSSLDDAQRRGFVPENSIPMESQPISSEEASARTQKDLEERKLREASTARSATGIPTRPDNYISPKEEVRNEGAKLQKLIEAEESVNPDIFNKKVKTLRSNTVVLGQIDADAKIRKIEEEYEDRIQDEKALLMAARPKEAVGIKGRIAALQKEGKDAVLARKNEIYKELGIPDLIKKESSETAVKKDLEVPKAEVETTQKQAPVASAAGQNATRSSSRIPDNLASSQSNSLVSSAEKTMAEFDKRQKAAERRQKARETYNKKLDKVIAGEWVKDPDSTDRYSSNARKKASDEDASLFISIQKEDDGWMVYTEEHEPEDISDVFSGDKAGKTRFFSLEQAKEAAGEFAEYYESLAQENKAQNSKSYRSEKPASVGSLPASTNKRSPSSKSVSTATSTAATQSPEREKASKLTVSRIKAILEAQGVSIPKGAKKDQLLDLLVPNSKTEQSNDAIATSEVYLAAYWETRDKFRRVS